MPILLYIKLGILAVAILAAGYFVHHYRSLERDNKAYAVQLETAQQAVQSAQAELVAKVAEHNAAFDKLKDDFAAEREQRKLSERNYAEANDKMADLMAKSQDEKAKYESGRLARLAAAKGGLLTRLARTSVKKRNSDWEKLTNKQGQEAPAQ